MNQSAARVSESRAAQAAKREDLYTTIHKALRALLCDALVSAGRMDCGDEAEVSSTLARVRQVIELTRHHLHHENQHVHPVLESRQRSSTLAAAREHTEHEQAFERLEARALAVERSQGAEREAAALDLYRELALYAAEDFRHMHAEENDLNALLWQHCSDAELKAVHNAIVSSVAPRVMADYLRWLAPALNPSERAELLSGMRQALPGEAFAGVLELVRSVIGAREWAKLVAALGGRPLAL